MRENQYNQVIIFLSNFKFCKMENLGNQFFYSIFYKN